MEFTEQAIILKTGRFREYDLWVRCLTPSRGVLTAFAFGGSVSRRRFCGCLEALNLCRFRFVESRGARYTQLAEGDLLQRHAELKAKPQRMGMAANCMGFVQSVESGREGAKEAFGMLAACLERLNDPQSVSDLLPVLFRARLTFALGYAPGLEACQGCGNAIEQDAFFAVASGGLLCASCRSSGSGALLSARAETVAALRSLKHGADWAGLDVSHIARRELYAIVEAYVGYHLGLGDDLARAS